MGSSQHFAFVFVVCGSKEHITTLHFSLKLLKRFTSKPIWVVTDKKRNDIEIEHDRIIDVTAPSDFNHHQASIWLKTSLHRILPKGTRYCYLDSDVITLNNNCNEVFSHFIPPISFAHDHTTLSYFSPYALNCGCLEKFQSSRNEFEVAVQHAIQHSNYPPDFDLPEIRALFSFQKQVLQSKTKLLTFLLKVFYAVVRGKVRFNKAIMIDVRRKVWIIGSSFTFPVLMLHHSKIRKLSGYRFNIFSRKWECENHEPLPENRCRHLNEALKSVFNVDVPSNWHHWNGGVFVFDESSNEFMEQWHRNTMFIFQNPFWKVRDQGTLIATVFQNDLQHHPMLPEKFNFIADFYKTEIKASEHENVFYKGSEKICPTFIHIYHHWGDEQWDVWQKVAKLAEKI